MTTEQLNHSVGIHWLCFTLPVENMNALIDRLTPHLGQCIDRPGLKSHLTTYYRYKNLMQFSKGGELAYRPERPECCLELNGQACSQFNDAEKLLDLIQDAKALGATFTRVDIFIDYIDLPFDLINCIATSCEAKELCRCRTSGEIKTNEAGYIPRGRTFYLGRPGSQGSGRYVRIYDKGLETKTRPLGEWIRWETQYSKDLADETCDELILSLENWKHTAYNLALSAVEFRVCNGNRALARRPLVPWWKQLTQSEAPIKLTKRRPQSDLDSWKKWIRKALLPSLHTIAKHSNQSVEQLMNEIADGKDFTKPLEYAPRCVLQYLEKAKPDTDYSMYTNYNKIGDENDPIEIDPVTDPRFFWTDDEMDEVFGIPAAYTFSNEHWTDEEMDEVYGD